MALQPGITQAQASHIYQQQHFANTKQELAREKAEVAKLVGQEFQRAADPNDPFQREFREHGGGEEVVYGGKLDAQPKELDLVRAWRPTASGEWELGTGVVHRVHQDSQMVTVQFLPDQHRCRLPFASVKPILDITPTYPKIRLAPGQRLPTRTELLQREQEAHERRQALGIPPHLPLPGDEDPNSLREGETLNEHGQPVIRESRWGIPATTLDALRNTSIPALQVGAEYGPHFYTKLYSSGFYAQEKQQVSPAGHVGLMQERGLMSPHIISHRYVPLDGQELEQDLRTGAWHKVDDLEHQGPEPKGWLAYLLE